MTRIVLASASPARARLLASAGIDAVVQPAAIDEAAIKQAAAAEGATVAEVALLLAELKALAISRRVPGALVIGADQMLVCGQDVFDKPPDLAAARAHLLALRGRRHVLVTAVVCARGGERIWHVTEQPALTMRRFSDAFLDAYLAAEGEALLGCVGAYRLEGMGVQLFDAIEGGHDAVLGLPLLPLCGFLRQHGVLQQ